MQMRADLSLIVNDALNLNGRISDFSETTVLLGALPELDSMGAVSLIAMIEERLDLEIEDGEIGGDIFENFGALLVFVSRKLHNQA